eukprot:scaffold219717_cov31-Tisochrysis_lutea.AAC.6
MSRGGAELLERSELERYTHAPSKKAKDGGGLYARQQHGCIGVSVRVGARLREGIEIDDEVPHVVRLDDHLTHLVLKLADPFRCHVCLVGQLRKKLSERRLERRGRTTRAGHEV